MSFSDTERVFHYFKEICSVPRGSGNTAGIAEYCVVFAKKNSLEYVKDGADNVIIFKPASIGFENAPPVILQGHLDMVCQKTDESNIDFCRDGIETYSEDGFIKAKGTTLGADNGIAVAMMLSVLENRELLHPAIEAVFTSDEEVGMIGAKALDMSRLHGKRMINLDSEEMDTVTVSCAGGSDFKAYVDFERIEDCSTELTVMLKGLKGGHSGVCINEGRVNANTLAGRFLNHINNECEFEIISINGGDKGNAIPPCCEIRLCSKDTDPLESKAEKYLEEVKTEISARESDFEYCIIKGKQGSYEVLPPDAKSRLIYILLCAPNGVVQMSAEIEGLVETSLNLGMLKTGLDRTELLFALRSNKKSALFFLEEKLKAFFGALSVQTQVGGHYPPWEYNSDSQMQKIYTESYFAKFGCYPKVEAIHAGLECGVFADMIPDFDGISIGPQLYDVHTVNERLDIASTRKIYELLLEVLAKCK